MRVNSRVTHCYIKSNARRVILAIIVVSGLLGARAEATSIGIDLGSAGRLTTAVGVPFEQLDGTHLSGQTLSLNFVFTKQEFARLFSITNSSFTILTTLRIHGSDGSDFLTGTGNLLNNGGGAMEPPQDLGSASGTHAMSVALFPLASTDLHKPLDFFGVHLDLTLPFDTSVTVTGGRFRLLAAGVNEEDRFGIGPGLPTDIIPESGSTIILLSVAGTALLVASGIARSCRARAGASSIWLR